VERAVAVDEGAGVLLGCGDLFGQELEACLKV
jgi:hypothetical protein